MSPTRKNPRAPDAFRARRVPRAGATGATGTDFLAALRGEDPGRCCARVEYTDPGRVRPGWPVRRARGCGIANRARARSARRVQRERPTAVKLTTSAPMPPKALARAVIPFAGTAAAGDSARAEQPGSLGLGAIAPPLPARSDAGRFEQTWASEVDGWRVAG